MSPQVRREEPPYVQVTNHYREMISRNELSEGDKLPSIRDIAEAWGIAQTTAAKAVNQLTAEGYVRTSPSGTLVTRRRANSPQERILSTKRTRSIRHQGEESEIRQSAIQKAPDYVADILGLDRGSQVLRRERVTYRGGDPIEISVTWMSPQFAEAVPELLNCAPVQGGTVRAVEEATGRRVTHGRDYIESRSADEREAEAIKVPIGAPILAATNVWSDKEGVIEYGECVMPAKRVISYEYAV
jgi:GntR family transcriptional regulator